MENPFVKLFAIDFKDHLEVKKSGNTELKQAYAQLTYFSSVLPDFLTSR